MSEAGSTERQPEQRRPHRWRRRLAVVFMLLLASLVSVELVGRFVFGLGDPPLFQSDPEMEYLFQPNQSLRRFGHVVHYNAYSMRADDFPRKKSAPDELRIFTIGDSVINGGVQTDQSQLMTSILQRELSQKLGRPVVVGNVSASSWGPPNELAYMKQYPDLLDADVLLIVISSHDVIDTPTFTPVVGRAIDMPDRKPLCATSELITRYVLPRLGAQLGASDAPPPAPTTQPTLDNPDVRRCLDALRQMIVMGKSRGARVIVAQHIEESETNGRFMPGHDLILDLARDAGAEIVQLAPAFEAALKAGRNPWRDIIHPNADGQRAMADALEPLFFGQRPASQPTLDSAPASR